MTKDEIPWHTDQKNGNFSYMVMLEEFFFYIYMSISEEKRAIYVKTCMV